MWRQRLFVLSFLAHIYVTYVRLVLQPRDPADFGFSEEFMDQLIKNQKSDPESEIYIPSNFSDCLADFGIIVSPSAPISDDWRCDSYSQ